MNGRRACRCCSLVVYWVDGWVLPPSKISLSLQVWMWPPLARILLVGGRLSRARPEGNSWKGLGARRASHLRRAMRLVQFHAKGSAPEPRIGLEEEDGGPVTDLNAFEPSLPRTMRAFLEGGEATLAVARR